VFDRAKEDSGFRKEITDIGGDVYLKTLIKLDDEARRWIGTILAGRN
jgi:hypothetical protein